jgi:hypothetical protein
LEKQKLIVKQEGLAGFLSAFVLKNLFLAFPDAIKQFFSHNFCYLKVLYEH